MAGLLYRPDMDEVRQRMTDFWHGRDLGRPAMAISVPRQHPLRHGVPEVPQPPNWITGYSTRSFAYRRYQCMTQWAYAQCMGELTPAVSPDLAPNCLALYLGCKGVESPGTVWAEPVGMEDIDQIRLEYEPNNFYWQFSQRLGRELATCGRGMFMQQFPDLIEGLDTLAALRDTQTFLVDLLERPEWVSDCLSKITQLYFQYYDVLYDIMRDEVGGSHFWCWAPGRMAKFQCDFSAMISPDMFGQFMVPVLREMTRRVSYCMYHWDGPGAIPHHDHLLSLPDLDMIQWTAGDGHEPSWHRRWWPLYHKTIDAGKFMHIGFWDGDRLDHLREMKAEFGHKLNHFLIGTWAKDRGEGEKMLAAVSD